MMNRRHALLGLPTLLGACATTSVADGTALGPDDGLLMLQVQGNEYGSLGYDRWGEMSVGAVVAENLLGTRTKVAFGPPEDTLVAPLPAGEYMWTRMNLDKHYTWWQQSTRFKIVRGAITYIGSLQITVAPDKKQVTVQVRDREAQAKALLAQRYPKYLATLAFQKSLAEMRVSEPPRS